MSPKISKFKKVRQNIKRAAIAATLATGLAACSTSPPPKITTLDIKNKKDNIIVRELNKIERSNDRWHYYDFSDSKRANPYLLTPIKPPSLKIKKEISKRNKINLYKFPKKKIIAVWNGEGIMSLDLELLSNAKITQIQRFVTKEDSIKIESIFYELSLKKKQGVVDKINRSASLPEIKAKVKEYLAHENLGDVINQLTPKHYEIIQAAFIKLPTDVQNYILKTVEYAETSSEIKTLKEHHLIKQYGKVAVESIFYGIGAMGLGIFLGMFFRDVAVNKGY